MGRGSSGVGCVVRRSWRGCTLLVHALAPPAAGARCITRLPVKVSLPDGPYAVAYTKQLRVRVNPQGVRIRNLRAELYTFSGERMGVTPRRRRDARVVATLKVRLGRIFRPLQVGGYTLVLTGEPNSSRSCGPKQAIRVVRMRACRTTLPVTFPELPGGRAGDYRDYLSVPVRSDGRVIRDLRSSVYGFDGSLLGRAPDLLALFGEQIARPPPHAAAAARQLHGRRRRAGSASSRARAARSARRRR